MILSPPPPLALQAAASTGAVCLDGSPPGYYSRAGVGPDRSKFLLVIQGGGWCTSSAGTEGAKEACSSRAATSLGSSKSWASHIPEDVHGMTSGNCTVNPAFCNWTVAYIYYCDGASFTGDNAAPVPVPGGKVSPIFFRGRRVLDANIDSLLRGNPPPAAHRSKCP